MDVSAALPSRIGSLDDCLKANGRKPGESDSAVSSRNMRRDIVSGTYVVRKKSFQSWKEKITNLDPDACFDCTNPRKVYHSLCFTWLLVKEPGDTTRFKQHIKICQAKPIPVGGTLTGMKWFKAKGGVETSGDRKGGEKGRGRAKVKMPCRGVSDVDDVLVDRYLRRTGAGGGGGRGIHVISRERFEREFRYLTRGQKEVVKATQRAEWTWRNDHQQLRIYSTNCERFTSSDSLNSSLCIKCKSLLILNAFIVAIHKKMPLDKNLKYTNGQYLNPVLGRLYATVKGLRAIIDHPVSNILSLKLFYSQ